MAYVHLRAVRTMAATPDAVRARLAAALREQGVNLAGDRPLVGQRGAQWAAALNPSKLPLQVWADVVPTVDGCQARIQLEDRWWSPAGKAWGMNRLYERTFGQLLAGVDHHLAQLDPRMVAPPPEFSSAAADIPWLELANQMLVRDHARAAVAAISRPPLRLNKPDATTTVEATMLQTMLVVAHQVVVRSDGAPTVHADRLPVLAARLDTAAAQNAASCQLSSVEGTTVEVLYLQAGIRATMPIRVEVTCTDCKRTKLTNPDYEKLERRNAVLRAVGETAGTLATGTVNPFALLGLASKYGNLDPDFVCSQCQGMEATERVVGLCPQCGTLCSDPFIVTCPGGHDLRTGVPALRWDARTLPPPPLSPPAPPPPSERTTIW